MLTLDRGYFSLTKSIERRLYEIARKHCGDQPLWKVNIDLLADKIGTTQERYRFRDELRQAITGDRLPEYHIALDSKKSPDDVVFYTRNPSKLSKELLRSQNYEWFQGLERYDKKPRTA